MPSRISQMRNGMAVQQPPQYQQPSQDSQALLNRTIEQTRGLMQMVKSAQNPQAALAQILQNNPNTAAISQMLRSGNSLEDIAKQMAQQRGIDINQLISQLQGGM